MALNALLEALRGVGNVLDTPASVLRGLAAAPFTGEWDRPFTGILDPEQRVSASEWTGEPWSGMAIDMVADPLNLLGGAGLLKIARAGRAAKATGLPDDVARLSDLATPISQSGIGDMLPMMGRPRGQASVDATIDAIKGNAPPIPAKELANYNDPSQLADLWPNIWQSHLDVAATRRPGLWGAEPLSEIEEAADAAVRQMRRAMGTPGRPRPQPRLRFSGVSSMDDFTPDLSVPKFSLPYPDRPYVGMATVTQQRPPNISPLLAALAGYNTARGGVYL